MSTGRARPVGGDATEADPRTTPDGSWSPDPTGDGGASFGWFAAPEFPDAAACTCPTVANIGYRMGVDLHPLLNPDCPLHHPEQVPDDAPTADGPVAGAAAGVEDRSAGTRTP